jgi:solute carrier family 25 carnitine/acylcarnitine transporter 20/29
VRSFGVRCLARGLGATVVRETPAYAAYYSVYFYGKRTMNATFPGGALWTHQVAAAMAAGLAYWSACYPIDVAKSIMQAQALDRPLPAHYRTVWATLAHETRQRGAGCLLRGIGPCYLRTLVAAPATFVTYDACCWC